MYNEDEVNTLNNIEIENNYIENNYIENNYIENNDNNDNNDIENIEFNIEGFEQTLRYTKNVFHGLYGSQFYVLLYKEWLFYEINHELIKQFALLKCNALLGDTINIHINKIVTYIWSISQYINYSIYHNISNTSSIPNIYQINKITCLFKEKEEEEEKEEPLLIDECNICYENTHNNNFIELNCKKMNCSHKICYLCIKKILIPKNTKICCSICRRQIITITTKDSNIQTEINQLI